MDTNNDTHVRKHISNSNANYTTDDFLGSCLERIFSTQKEEVFLKVFNIKDILNHVCSLVISKINQLKHFIHLKR